MSDPEQMQGFLTELRRGSLTLAVLGCLREPSYGYALLQTLQARQLAIEANTLYPLLRRLEGQGLLSSEWDTTESRPRKYYRASAAGLAAYRALYAEWTRLQQSIDTICGEGGENGSAD